MPDFLVVEPKQEITFKTGIAYMKGVPSFGKVFKR